MNLARLLAPRSIAIVGASGRPGSYGNQAVANLAGAGFAGKVFGVHPTATSVHGVPCVPKLADLPLAPDAVVIATPAATVPAIVAEAGALGCGGAVVFAAGFAEVSGGAGLQEDLRAAAAAHGFPVCGPNGNGIVSVRHRAPMWGDSCTPRRAGPIALISQSGNVAVNALGSTRALRLHTVVSCGNQAVLDAADYLAAVADLEDVRAVALYLEAEGSGAKLAEALARCADQGIGVTVLKAGSSARGAAAATAHTGSIAGDARVFRALVEEAGGAWARNPHELLELAKALAYGRRTP
ncbi:MAG TPA: CoA-binding protein, partial [Micromonosporaceae bacterium]|nr:CoA-binding protein [Micromonosporaceae bacterium]